MTHNEQLEDIRSQCRVWEEELAAEVAKLTARLDGIKANNPLEYEQLGAATERELARLENDLMDLRTFADTLPQEKADDSDTWGAYILRLMNDEEFRAAESYTAELGRLAQAKQLERFGEWHEYMDATVDLPILNAETYEAAMERQRQEDEDD